MDTLQGFILADLKFRNDSTLIPDVLHVLPPFFGLELEQKLFSQLLVENESPGGAFSMEVVEGTVVLVVVAV